MKKVLTLALVAAVSMNAFTMAPAEAFPSFKKVAKGIFRAVELPLMVGLGGVLGITVGAIAGGGMGITAGAMAWYDVGEQDKQLEAAKENAAKMLEDLKNHVPTPEEQKRSDEMDALMKEGERLLKEFDTLNAKPSALPDPVEVKP